jgi:hypothetical protein
VWQHSSSCLDGMAIPYMFLAYGSYTMMPALAIHTCMAQVEVYWGVMLCSLAEPPAMGMLRCRECHSCPESWLPVTHHCGYQQGGFMLYQPAASPLATSGAVSRTCSHQLGAIPELAYRSSVNRMVWLTGSVPSHAAEEECIGA